MKKYLLNFLPLLLITSLISSFNVTNSYAQNFSLKLESQPVCLDSLKSVWQEFGSPFPCFTSGSLIELSKPVPGSLLTWFQEPWICGIFFALRAPEAVF